jgi:mono/diheme cytochrome c family protein
MRKFLTGALVAYLLLALLAYGVVRNGLLPAAADRKPGPLERWAALHSLHTAIRRESRGLADPRTRSDDDLVKGAQIYRSNCLVCHGAADGKASPTARGLGLPPPQLAAHGVEDDPEGETYWKVKHGIRFTGMPAYVGSLTEEELWQVTRFVSHLEHLSPAAAAAWKAMPSAAPAP